MAKDYLFEIGTEEMPAHVVPRSVSQLADRTRKFLKENGLKFKDIKTFSTPRRLTILVEDLAEKQDDIDEVKKGPAKKIAQDADGNWTKAAQGFARGQGMTTTLKSLRALNMLMFTFKRKVKKLVISYLV